MYQTCSGFEAPYPWWYRGTGVGSDFLGSRWGHQAPARTKLKPLWYLLCPSQSWLLFCLKYELQMIFLILPLAITRFCLSALQHFLRMWPAVPTAELAAPLPHQPTHSGITPSGCGDLGVQKGRMECPHPPLPPGSSLLQLPDPCVAVGGFAACRRFADTGVPEMRLLQCSKAHGGLLK